MQGHDVNLGPDLTDTIKRVQGDKLLRQILESSHEINEKYQDLADPDDRRRSHHGLLRDENERRVQVIPNLLTPEVVRTIRVDDIELRSAAKISSMPEGLVNVLTREEILDLLAFIEAGGYELPEHLRHGHQHGE